MGVCACLVLVAVAFFSAIPLGSCANTYSFDGPWVINPDIGGWGQEHLANTTVVVTYTTQSGLIYRDSWDSWSTGSFSENLSISPILTLTWNMSSALNYTGQIDFPIDETGGSYFIYVCDPDIPAYEYNINIIDFAGMTNPYLQLSTLLDFGSYQSIISRHNLNSSSSVPFILNQYQPYKLSVVCDEGTYTQTFTPGNEFTVNIPVLAGMFGDSSSPYTYPQLYAQRTNSSLISIVYSDSTEDTDWLNLEITHLSGSSEIFDYSQNQTGDSQTILWNSADASTSYMINATASIGDVEYDWVLHVSQAPTDNPFEGVFDFLGVHTDTLPTYYSGWPEGMTSYQIAQLIAACLITLFLGIGSFRNAGASAIIACIFAGIMFAVGWWNGGVSQASVNAIPELGLAFFIAIWVHFSEKKSMGEGLS